MSWEFTRDMIHPDDAQALVAFEDRKQRCEAYYQFLRERGVASILEIGVRCGYCARAMLEAAPNANYIGIDKSRTWLPWWERLCEGFRASYVVGDSRNVLSYLADQCFDIVHVDGDHSTEGASQDIEMAMGLVSPNGVIIVDDCEAKTVWEAVKRAGLNVAPYEAEAISHIEHTGQLSIAFTVKP